MLYISSAAPDATCARGIEPMQAEPWADLPRKSPLSPSVCPAVQRSLLSAVAVFLRPWEGSGLYATIWARKSDTHMLGRCSCWQS